MPSSFKFWIMHFTTFCLCLYPESDSPVEDFLVRKHCGTKFWESLSLFTRRNLVVILEALKVEKSLGITIFVHKEKFGSNLRSLEG